MPIAHVFVTLSPILVFLGLLYLVSERARRRERAEYDQWWKDYQDREDFRDLQLAWVARFTRAAGETEKAFLRRFRIHLATLTGLEFGTPTPTHAEPPR